MTNRLEALLKHWGPVSLYDSEKIPRPKVHSTCSFKVSHLAIEGRPQRLSLWVLNLTLYDRVPRNGNQRCTHDDPHC